MPSSSVRCSADVSKRKLDNLKLKCLISGKKSQAKADRGARCWQTETWQFCQTHFTSFFETIDLMKKILLCGGIFYCFEYNLTSKIALEFIDTFKNWAMDGKHLPKVGSLVPPLNMVSNVVFVWASPVLILFSTLIHALEAAVNHSWWNLGGMGNNMHGAVQRHLLFHFQQAKLLVAFCIPWQSL